MDSNHCCQTQHYNKQSLSCGGETGIWEEHNVICRAAFDLSSRKLADERNWSNNTYSAECQDTVGSFFLNKTKQNTTNESLSFLSFIEAFENQACFQLHRGLWRAVHLSKINIILQINIINIILQMYTHHYRQTYYKGSENESSGKTWNAQRKVVLFSLQCR